MLVLQAVCPCYLLPAYHPDTFRYTLNEMPQYQLHLLTVTFTTCQQISSQCSLSVPTLFVNCFLHTFPNIQLPSLCSLSVPTLPVIWVLHTFPKHSSTLSMLALSTTVPVTFTLHLPKSFSHPFNARTQYQIYLLYFIFKPSKHIQLHFQCSLSIPN